MARLTLLASALLVFLVVAEASIYRTIITTEVSQGGMPEQCRREIMQANLRHCENYIRQASQSMLELVDINQQQQVPPECCTQLREMSSQCRCPAVARAMQQAMGGYGQQQYSERAMRTAEQLTGKCNVDPQYCDVRQQGY